MMLSYIFLDDGEEGLSSARLLEGEVLRPVGVEIWHVGEIVIVFQELAIKTYLIAVVS
jgi:hypothetical protein